MESYSTPPLAATSPEQSTPIPARGAAPPGLSAHHSTTEQEAILLRESRKHLGFAKSLNRKAKALCSGYLRSQTYERLNDFFILAESVQEKQARALGEGRSE